jgi:hypothetical protein
MKSNLKMLLTTIGVAALLGSPAMAGSSARHRAAIHRDAAAANVYLPGNAYGYKGGAWRRTATAGAQHTPTVGTLATIRAKTRSSSFDAV